MGRVSGMLDGFRALPASHMLAVIVGKVLGGFGAGLLVASYLRDHLEDPVWRVLPWTFVVVAVILHVPGWRRVFAGRS